MPRPRLSAIAWPLFIELALGIAIGLFGIALAAKGGDASAAAFALTNHVAAALFILFRVIGAGASVIVTQHLGGGRRAAADDAARTALGASTWIGLVTAGTAFIGAAVFVRLMQAPADVAAIAVPFLQALAITILLDAWIATLVSVLRAHLRPRHTLATIVTMHAVHAALAVPLVLGWGVIPAMGLTGYAIALAIGRVVAILMGLWWWRSRLHLSTRMSDWWRVRRAPLSDILHIGLPGAAENIAYRLCFMVSVAAASTLGATALAAQSYALQVMYGVLLCSLSLGLATEVAVGHLVGAGQLREAQALVKRTLGLGLVLSVCIAALTALASPIIFANFTSDKTIIALATTLMWCTVILEPGRTFNVIVINALRAAGDARFPVQAGIVSMLVVLAGGSWVLGVEMKLGVVGIWIAYAADEWARGLVMWLRWTRQHWVPSARAMHRRLRERSRHPTSHQLPSDAAT
jgi:putative MATE family efflux protein